MVETKPKVYKTKPKKGKKTRYFILLNGKKKYIKPDDPNMSEKEIIEFIQTNYKIKKKAKKTKKATKRAVVSRQPLSVLPEQKRLSLYRQPVSQQPIKRSSVIPSSISSTMPIRPSFPSSISVPSVSTTTTKQDIPEITNLLSELRTYKDSDKKRQAENAQLELEKKQILLDKQNAELAAQQAKAEEAAAKLRLDEFNKKSTKGVSTSYEENSGNRG